MGILFHQYLSGKLPGFDEEKYSCAGEAVAAGEKLKLSLDIPTDLRRVICKMLAADPCERLSAQQVFSNLTKPDTNITLRYDEEIADNQATHEEVCFAGDAPARPGFWDMGDL